MNVIKNQKRAGLVFLFLIVVFIIGLMTQQPARPQQITGLSVGDGQRTEQCRSDYDCDSSVRCFRGVCGACSLNEDCTLLRQVCSAEGNCEVCENDRDCPQDHFCNEGGECEFRSGVCQTDEDCTDTQLCQNNRCVIAEGNSCASDAECARGMFCDTGVCYPPCQDSDGGINVLQSGVMRYGRHISYSDNSVHRFRIDTLEARETCETIRPINGPQIDAQTEHWCDTEQYPQGLDYPIYAGCQGRTKCVQGQNQCTYTPLKNTGEACSDDTDCSLGLACESNTCRPLPASSQIGSIVPNTLGRQCATDNDCRGNVEPPSVVCESNHCTAGVASSCRTGCSMHYPCIAVKNLENQQEQNMCSQRIIMNNIPLGGVCREHDQCASGACVISQYPFEIGQCEERLRRSREQCFVHTDCETGVCTQNRCQASSEFMPCRENADCARGLECTDGLCLQNRRENVLSEGCESFRELFPGYNDPQDKDRINLVFVLVNAPQDMAIRQKLAKYINYKSTDVFGKNSLFNVEPFKSNKDRFNLWFLKDIQRVNPPEIGQGCDIVCGNPKEETRTCRLNNKLTANLCFIQCRAKGSFRLDGPLYTPTFIRGDMAKQSTLTHEIGHNIGKLSDEYNEEGKGSFPSFPNCARTRGEAQHWWKDLEGRGEGDLTVRYENGCAYTAEQIRPTKNSIMNDDAIATGYGDVNYRHLCYRILKLTKKVDAACLRAISAAPRDAHHALYTKALEKISGNIVANIPAKKQAIPKQNIPRQQSRTSPKPQGQCDQNGACDKRGGETIFTCPTDCGKTVLTLKLTREGDVYTIPSYAVVEQVPYVPYFEDSGIFEAQITLTAGKIQLTKYFNLRTPEIVETFIDGPTVPPELRRNEIIQENQLVDYGIRLHEFKLEYDDELSVDIPLDKKISDQFRLALTSVALGISQTFVCQQGTCISEFSK